MADVFEDIGKGVETAAKDVAHVVVEAVEFPAKAEKVFATITTDYPAVKAALQKLVTDGAAVDADAVAAIQADGLNVTVDVALWNALVTAVKDLKASITEVENAWEQINADVQ